MKIAVATKQGGLEDKVSPIVGRAPSFTIVETSESEIVNSGIIENDFAQSSGGAGIQAAQMLVQENIDAILGGNFGPNLANVFSQTGVDMYQVGEISVDDAVSKLVAGELSPVADATGPAHGGMGRGRAGGQRGGQGSRRGGKNSSGRR